ncbi:hypothetical protein ACQ4PT_053018 [Festuca glaucescens]
MTNWYRGSLLPPPIVDEGSVADPLESCLLDRKLFLGGHTNATTAWYDYPEDDEVSIQPMVVSTHNGLVLLSIAFSKNNSKLPEFYMYQPGVDKGDDNDRLLELIPQPSDMRLVDQRCAVGLLPSHGGSGDYHIAALTMSMQAKGVFDLYVFSSKTKSWTVRKPSLPAVDSQGYMAVKAIPLGGGSIAFVDFYKGILICDVLDGPESPELHYIPLPSEELCQPLPDAYPYIPHDLTLHISSQTIRIKFANVVCPLLSGDWRIETFSTTTVTESPWSQLNPWKKDSTVDASQLSVHGSIELSGLLDHGDGKQTLGSLFVEKPMLSLHEDNIVCLMAKQNIMDRQLWVIAVDIENKELQGVIHLGVGRRTALIYSTISGHLNNVAATASTGEKGDLKRLGASLESKTPRKLFRVASLVGEQEKGVTGTDDGDDMDLELE